MLKMECSNCGRLIELKFHVEMEKTVCPGCSNTVQVKDVLVAAGPYLILRDVLIKNMYKYKRLLQEAEKEIDEVRRRGPGTKSADLSADSISMFVNHLKELLNGCRKALRHDLEDTGVTIVCGGRRYEGRVVNMSLTGACVDSGELSSITRLWNDVSLEFSMCRGPVKADGRIVWVGARSLMGIRFIGLDEEAERLLEGIISEKSILLKKLGL